MSESVRLTRSQETAGITIGNPPRPIPVSSTSMATPFPHGAAVPCATRLEEFQARHGGALWTHALVELARRGGTFTGTPAGRSDSHER